MARVQEGGRHAVQAQTETAPDSGRAPAYRAVLLIHGYWRDRRYRPSEAELWLFLDLERRLFRSAATARRIALRMEWRFQGEPEIDERKWNP